MSQKSRNDAFDKAMTVMRKVEQITYIDPIVKEHYREIYLAGIHVGREEILREVAREAKQISRSEICTNDTTTTNKEE